MTSSNARSSLSPIIFISHAADPDVPRLQSVLARCGLSTHMWVFDGTDTDVQVEAAANRFKLIRGNHSLSTADLETASAIIHRVGSGSWDRPVSATVAGSASERQFAEREWRTFLHAVMLDAEKRYSHLVWINKPSAALLASNKHYLLTTADLVGLSTPSTSVSTSGRLPSTRSGGYVSKAINENEVIDDDRTFMTALLPHTVICQQPYNTNCPSLIQERIDAAQERRVYYLLGHFLAIDLITDADHVDIRQVPRELVSARRTAIPPQLTRPLSDYCRLHQLSYCTFDFLLTRQGQHILIDVTPSGTWSHYEPLHDHYVTEWYARTLLGAIQTGHESGRAG